MSIGTEFRKKTADTYPSRRFAKPIFASLLRRLARRLLARPRKPIGGLLQTPP